MNDMSNFRRRAVSALFWSLFQNWGGRALSMVVFVLLARLLAPAQFGIASSAFLVMSMLSLVAEFGYGDALIQKQGLKGQDVNIPFYASMILSTALACIAAFMSEEIARLMKVEGLAPYLIGTAAICPFMTLASFQDAMYRRHVQFRALAMRTLAGITIGGVVGVVMALVGFGTWALIGQFAAQTLTSVAWLWARPVWKPDTELNWSAMSGLSKFGVNVLGQRLIDFFTLRSIDFVILLVYGPASLALFTVSSRLYQLLLQLLQSSISSVGLSMLSKVSDDKVRLQRLYLRSSSIGSFFGTPVFFGLAALAPEVNHIMFGQKWAGAEHVMVPLLLMGGIHCVQFINASYLTALGRPQALLRLVILKAVLVLPPLYFIRMDSVAGTAVIYCASLVCLTPFSFGATLKALSLNWAALIKPVAAPMLACAIAFLIVFFTRGWGGFEATNVFLSALIHGLLFVVAYAVCMIVLAFDTGRENLVFIQNAIRK
ncbi:oligosaccharide flippase family protein [Rhizobium binxianense]|uniref:oligosaccharide flippase family protein n=1 Tax=Rhizobium binxianense TaxID=3024242 RepID=UPI0023612EC6|nr:oligosaccharide flippase family protein [Rhizobium sp. MJ37]MDC9837290.1 oligosaccharide flippase family protein [Rhizobium sp. MJ37]